MKYTSNTHIIFFNLVKLKKKEKEEKNQIHMRTYQGSLECLNNISYTKTRLFVYVPLWDPGFNNFQQE